MKYLLDTHALIWWLNDDKHLSETARELIQHPDTDIHVSAVSAWEIATKLTKGKLPMAINVLPDFSAVVAENGFMDLPITSAHMVRSALLVSEHKDPFDRILAAQAILEGMSLISVAKRCRRSGPSCDGNSSTQNCRKRVSAPGSHISSDQYPDQP